MRSLKKIIPGVMDGIMGNLMEKLDKKDLLDIIRDNKNDLNLQIPAAKKILEKNPSIDELSIIIEYVPKFADFVKPMLNYMKTGQLEIEFKEP